jgi:hypothetical protein
MKNPLPDDVQFGYNTFLQIANDANCVFAGLMMRVDPPFIAVIGNVKETGHNLATLLRKYADIVDDAHISGNIERPE